MAFTPQFLDELRNRLSIGAVIGRRVRLQRRGKELTGLCPFHNEKTPSFTVSEDKGFFHCFGCGAHGDVVGFVMQSEGLGFREAVEKLAAEAGLPIPRDTPEERHRAERQQSLHDVLGAAADWFAEQLRGPGGRAAREYLLGRGLEQRTIEQFRLGFAPDGRRGLLGALTRAGFEERLLVEAGLVIRPQDGDAARDRFRNRVMFPITDRSGRVIAFGGRILGDGEPKYLNSPETPLFHKGRTLYNLAQATRAARDSGEVIVVEGYMDVIALAQAGMAHAVAPLGTALTEEQVALLWRMAPEPILCFDGDSAGQRAAARALDRTLPLLKPGLSLRFAMLPPGEDPDSLLRAAGPTALREVLAQAQPMVSVLWQLETAGRDLGTPERRAGFRQHLREKIRAIADRTVQEDYRAEIERRLEEAFPRPGRGGRAFRPGQAGWGQVGRGALPLHVSDGQAARRGTHAMIRFQLETILATLLSYPALVAEFAEDIAHLEFPPGPLQRLRDLILEADAAGLGLDSQSLRSHLCGLGLAAALDEVRSRTRGQSFTRPQAGIDKAREGLSHALGIVRAADAMRERELAAAALGQDPTEEALERFHAAFRATLDGEAQRRDLDGEAPAGSRAPAAKGSAA